MPDGLGVHLGGLYREEAIIPSSFGYSLPHPKAEELYQLFCNYMLAGFTKVQHVYVGPDAARLWREGVELVYVAGGQPVIADALK